MQNIIICFMTISHKLGLIALNKKLMLIETSALSYLFTVEIGWLSTCFTSPLVQHQIFFRRYNLSFMLVDCLIVSIVVRMGTKPIQSGNTTGVQVGREKPTSRFMFPK